MSRYIWAYILTALLLSGYFNFGYDLIYYYHNPFDLVGVIFVAVVIDIIYYYIKNKVYPDVEETTIEDAHQ